MPSLSRYEVLQPIGENHFATYHRGFDTTGERDVCIVQFLDKFRRNPDRWEQLWQQILSAGRLKHDFLVSVYDYDRERGWVITELMQGALRDLDAEALGETELVRTVLYRTLETLDYIHSNQFVHGDVRPASLLYDIAGQTKLSFSPGLSLGGQIPRREKDHAYLAPELFDPSFGEIGVGVDLYGCGMSALSLLLGKDFSKKLLGSGNSSDIAWQRFHLDESAQPSVRELLPHLPRDMETVIQKLISKKVDNRFTSIAEARALLTRPEVEVKIQVPNAPPKAAPEKRRAVSTADVPMAFRETSAPTTKSKAADPGYPPWSREWINLKLKNPLVMASVCGGIFLMMILAMVFISSMKPKKLVAVSVSSLPPGASIVVDDETFEARTDAEVQIPVGEHQLKLELEGYQPHTQTIEVPANELSFAVPVVNLLPMPPPSVEQPQTVAKTDPAKNQPVTDKPKPVDSSAWQLPTGLAAVGDETDKATGLPLRAEAMALNDSLQDSDIPLTLILIPAGDYQLNANEPRQTGELESRTVTIETPFYIGEFEVTRAQWEAFTEARSPGDEPVDEPHRNHPVAGVSFDAATEFAAWLGEAFAIPSEDEWEAAARGIDGSVYPWGDEQPSAQHVHMRAFAPRPSPGSPRTVDVDALPGGASPRGVHHLLGNVAEWCREVYAPGFEETDATTGAGKLHVIRGGSFRSPAGGAVRIAWRANAPDDGANDVGLRVVCHLKPPRANKN